MPPNTFNDLPTEQLLGIRDRCAKTILRVAAMSEEERHTQRPKGAGTAASMVGLNVHFFQAADLVLQERGLE